MNRITPMQAPIIILCCLFLLVACSTTQTLKKTIMPNNGPFLKKRVLLVPIMVQADMDQEKITRLNEMLFALLEKDARMIVQRMDGLGLSDETIELLQTGAVLDPVQTKKFETLGINVILTAVLRPIDIVTQKSGFLFFRKEKSEAVISMMLNALDITTNTLLATNLESEKIKLSTVIPEDQETRNEIDDARLDQALSSVLDDLVQYTSDILGLKPWLGRLSMTQDATLRINGGSDIGVLKGRVFEVFGEGEPIRDFKGSAQFTFGPEVGEIKTVEVMSDYSIAVPLSGESFKNGPVIRIKRP